MGRVLMAKWKVIKPKPIKKRAMLAELRVGVQKTAEIVKDYYDDTTRSWERNNVLFSLNVKTISGNYTFSVKTSNKLYLLLDVQGAKPHPIRPRNPAGFLIYPQNFTPRTQVGVIGSQPGGRVGATTVRKSVKHPGFQARGFSKAIAKESQKDFLEQMKIAMRNAVAASGHNI